MPISSMTSLKVNIISPEGVFLVTDCTAPSLPRGFSGVKSGASSVRPSSGAPPCRVRAPSELGVVVFFAK